ncbi:MAG TPA: DUF1569 domain-containing protein [Chryseolinea sp.]
MKTVFDENVRIELINRIHSVKESSSAQWGKMNAYQMVKHCTLWDTWILGKNNPEYKQSIIGLLFGKIALPGWVKDDSPLKRNIPTSRDMIVKEKVGDVELQKKEWIERIAEYEHFSNPAFIHDFFGRMKKEEIGIFAYKHSDHHLRQFNC